MINMTVNDMASQYYNQYSLSGSAAYQQNAAGSQSAVDKDCDITDLTSALEAVGQANTPYPAIADVSQYASDLISASQLSVAASLENMQSNFGIYTNLQDAAVQSYRMNSLGLNSGADPNGIPNLNSYAEDLSLSSKVAQNGYEDSSYESYLDKDSIGSVLDTTA